MPASTFSDILKFNPYHDSKGRFSTSGTAASFTYAPGKSKAHDLAIERHKERMAGVMPTAAQDKALRSIASRTRNLRNEQFRVVDRDGNVVMEKKGDRTSVSYSIGEARDNFPGNITIHNHPDGGTFSTADLSDIGYGATEIRAAAPEGTYTLRNLNHGTRWNANQRGWYEMRDDLEAASQGFKNNRQLRSELRGPFEERVKPIATRWEQRRAAGASQDELNSIAQEYTREWDAAKVELDAATRTAYVGQYHSWYRSNAGAYGFEYEFTPANTRTRKSADADEIGKSDGEIVLDRKIKEDVDEIVADIIQEYPRTLGNDMQKSFSIFKTDDDKRLVFGWASVSISVDGEQLEDRQQDMIDPEDLEEAVYEYVLNFRDAGEEHIPSMRKKGKLVESCVLTEEKQRAMGIPAGTVPIAWWIGFKVEDDDAWERVKNGTYRMFSIEGKAKRVPVEKSVEKDVDKVEKSESSQFDLIQEVSAPTISKSAGGRYDLIQELPVAKTFADILKFNPYHDSRGRFASASGAASFTYAPGKSRAHDLAIQREQERGAMAANRQYGATNTSDAAAEIADGKTNSLAAYMDENGKLSAEREAVHRQIIDDMLQGKIPVDGQATMTMLGGGPASGKSSVMNPDTSNDPHAVTVDPDAFKHALPGFKEMAESDPNAASYYHEESSALAKRFAEVAYSENYNVIYDGTGDGSTRSVQSKIDAARANGYRVEARYVSVDTETAVQRNQKRYDDAIARGETPRLPPVDMVRSTHAKCTDISVSMASQFDYIEIWDNNGARGEQRMIASGGNGRGLTVVSGQEAAFTNYLNKSSSGAEGFVTLPDGQVVPVEP